jgi:hypothetical protein
MSTRDDPISGLFAWPGFFARLPTLIAEHLHAGRSIGLSLGEIHDLAGYVESMSVAGARSSGHIAGVELVSRLGAAARDWLQADDVRNGCLATFGGGDIVFVAEVRSETAFLDHVGRLRAVLGDALPRSVSFAATVLDARSIPDSVPADGWRDFCVHVIARVERALLVQSGARRQHRPSLPIATISIR